MSKKRRTEVEVGGSLKIKNKVHKFCKFFLDDGLALNGLTLRLKKFFVSTFAGMQILLCQLIVLGILKIFLNTKNKYLSHFAK